MLVDQSPETPTAKIDEVTQQPATGPSVELPSWATASWGYYGAAREIFKECALARLLLLVLWRFHRNRPDDRFGPLREDLHRMAKLPKVEKNKEFQDLGESACTSALLTVAKIPALHMLPGGRARQRRILIEAILAWIEEVPSAPSIPWTRRMDVSLLKLVLCNNGSLKGILPIMRSYDPDVTLIKIRQRIPLLLSLPDQPALEMLRRTCPNWWRSMLLGDSTRIAVCILRKASAFRVKKERVEEFAEAVKFLRYDGVVGKLAREDKLLAPWLPTTQLSLEQCAAFLNSWPEDSGVLSAGDKEMIEKTRLAIYSRHLARLPLTKK